MEEVVTTGKMWYKIFVSAALSPATTYNNVLSQQPREWLKVKNSNTAVVCIFVQSIFLASCNKAPTFPFRAIPTPWFGIVYIKNTKINI